MNDPQIHALLLYATWAFTGLGFIALSFPSIRALINARYRKAPLEIVFDPSNPARRFWSFESTPDPSDPNKHIAFHETRVKL